MATVTKTFRENGGVLVDYSTPSEGATWTVSIVGADYNVFNDSGLLEIADPTMTAKYVQYSSDAAKRRAYIDCEGQILINGVSYLGAYAYLTKRRADGAATSGTTYTIAKRSDSSFPFSVDLTKVFNANTPTLKTAAITLPSYNMWLESYYGGTASSSPTNDSYYQGSLSFGTIGYVYYKCPPELATCNILKDTPSGYYANHTNVTIEVPITYSTVSQSGTAKYGGYIKKIEATIGTESSVLTFDESTKPTSKQTLTLNPTIVGNDIPVSVTVTDSRDQSTTQSLGTINVLTYNKPSVGFDVYRTDNVGKKTDEGAYAIIDAQVTYTPDLTTIKQKPTITVDGVNKTSNVTWYSSWTANGGVVSGSAISNWSSISSGSKIYGLINNNFSDTNSYQINMVVTDTLDGTSDPVIQTLSTAFYTIDFQAGGKEIAFGAPANDDLAHQYSGYNFTDKGLFKCNMDSMFRDRNNVVRLLFDFVYPVGSYYETSDTTFNPNVTWGGTWILETEGQVHISSGSNYLVNGAGTNTSDGGSPYIQEHTHAFTQPKIPNHHHSMGNIWSNGTGSSQAYQYSNSRTLMTRNTATDGGGGACTGGAVGAVSGATTGDSGNMPPYIVVNRWHRTA